MRPNRALRSCWTTPRPRCGYAALRPSPHVVRSRSLMLSQEIVDSLFPPDLPESDHWEHRYPPRDLPEGAKVTRFAPSPTGFLTIRRVFAATVSPGVAPPPGGVH